MTRDQAKSFLEENQVKFVLAQFVDIHGVAKTKSVPVSHFEDILNDGAGFAGFAVWGLGQEPHDPDFMAVGDLSTLTLIPWQPGYARIVCNGRVRGEPYRYDTRYILEQQIERLNQKGWTLNTGLEPEFMLLGEKSRRLAASCRRLRHTRQALLRLQGTLAQPEFPGKTRGCSSSHGLRRLSD